MTKRLAVLPLLLAALLIAACGSTGSGPTSPAAPTSTPTSTTPTGPPSAQFTLVGTNGLGGVLTVADITCSQPSLDGVTIVVNGTNPAAPGVSIRVTIQAGTATVLADAGSGLQFTSREFSGPGVTAFDAARGAQVNATLTEASSSGHATGSIGAVTSVSGSVACNNQQPGTSTVTLTGSTASGTLNGGIAQVEVRCMANGSALTLGVTMIGTTPVFVDMYGGSGQISLILVPKGATQGQHFTANGANVTTLSANGVHFNADVDEDAVAGTTPHKVHISGDVTCGTSLTP